MFHIEKKTYENGFILIIEETVMSFFTDIVAKQYYVNKNDVWFHNFSSIEEGENFLNDKKVNMYVCEATISAVDWIENYYLPKAEEI